MEAIPRDREKVQRYPEGGGRSEEGQGGYKREQHVRPPWGMAMVRQEDGEERDGAKEGKPRRWADMNTDR